MKMFRIVPNFTTRWWYPVSQKGSHVKLNMIQNLELIIFPNHGSQELKRAGKENSERCEY
jgi:predicted RNA binding protein YcfA (HicA-like mRNA interferase family)